MRLFQSELRQNGDILYNFMGNLLAEEGFIEANDIIVEGILDIMNTELGKGTAVELIPGIIARHLGQSLRPGEWRRGKGLMKSLGR